MSNEQMTPSRTASALAALVVVGLVVLLSIVTRTLFQPDGPFI